MAKIIWAVPAIQDLDAIAGNIALDKPSAARQLVRQVLTSVGRLRKFSRLGSIPRELHGLPYRQLAIPPCRVFYRAEKTTVYVVHVLRGEQQVRLEMFARQQTSPQHPRKRRRQGPPRFSC
jgi:toxin ParE1/3/4